MANFKHVYVESGFVSGEKPVVGAYGKIIYRVAGLGPQFFNSKICICFTHSCTFYPVSEGKTNTWFSSLIFK